MKVFSSPFQNYKSSSLFSIILRIFCRFYFISPSRTIMLQPDRCHEHSKQRTSLPVVDTARTMIDSSKLISATSPVNHRFNNRDIDHPASATRHVRFSNRLQIPGHTTTITTRCRQELLDNRIYTFDSTEFRHRGHYILNVWTVFCRRNSAHTNSSCTIRRIKTFQTCSHVFCHLLTLSV